MDKLLEILGILGILGIGVLIGGVAWYFSTSGSTIEKKVDTYKEQMDNENTTPDIVTKEQRKERVRQNSQWTAENKRAYPVEFCQAQLRELDKHMGTLETAAMELNINYNKVQKNLKEAEKKLKNLDHFLEIAKKAYRDTKATGQWPVTVNGFPLTEEQLKKQIVQAARKKGSLPSDVVNMKTQLALMSQKKDNVFAEQQRVIQIQERVQQTLNDLKINKVMKGTDSLASTLDAIENSIDSLGTNTKEPSLEMLTTPNKEAAVDSEFDEIMGK